jgi:hypothetical protein
VAFKLFNNMDFLTSWVSFSAMVNSFSPLTHCHQKKEGPNITQHIDCFQRTQAPMFSWSTPYSSGLRHHTTHWLPTDSFRRTLQNHRRTNALLPHNNRADFTVSISCLVHSHKCQLGKLSHYITDYTHSPKAQACFPSNVHKTSDSQCCLVPFSLTQILLQQLD